MKKYHKSPEISIEEKMKHDRDLMRYNYWVALDELEFLMERSKLSTAYVKANERTWSDQKDRVWVCDSPLTTKERATLTAVLEVIQGYEKSFGSEQNQQDQARADMAAIRAKNEERSHDRLANFEKLTVFPSPKIEPGQGREQDSDIDR